MKPKAYTLLILLTTFALIWENEKRILSGIEKVHETITETPVNEWLKTDFKQTIDQTEHLMISFASKNLEKIREALKY